MGTSLMSLDRCAIVQTEYARVPYTGIALALKGRYLSR